jgi:hypothetical protein
MSHVALVSFAKNINKIFLQKNTAKCAVKKIKAIYAPPPELFRHWFHFFFRPELNLKLKGILSFASHTRVFEDASSVPPGALSLSAVLATVKYLIYLSFGS